MEDGSSGIEPNLGTRRMCVAVAGAGPGLLASALQAGAFDRMYVEHALDGGLAVAPAGVDEIRLVLDLVAAVCHRLARFPAWPAPVFMALNVGIVRIVGDGFGGPGLQRTRLLARHPIVRRAASGIARSAKSDDARLAVVMSEGLYADLRTEGLAEASWHHVPEAAAWLRWVGGRPDEQDGKEIAT